VEIGEVAGDVEVEISPGKAGLWFWCCFFIIVGVRASGRLR